MGTPIPDNIDPSIRINDPEFDDANEWFLSGGMFIVGGKFLFRSGLFARSGAAAAKPTILGNLLYRIDLKLSNVSFDPADELNLLMGVISWPIPKVNGEHTLYATFPNPTMEPIGIRPKTIVGNNQTFDMEYFRVWENVSQVAVTYNLLGQVFGFYDSFELAGEDSMEFYASKKDRTRIWIKHG